jgi:LPXTG-motif cell wall-anchored protein
MKGNLIMRTFKKLLSLFTALLMSIGMGITPIMADTTDNGTITIINAQENVEYTLYRLFTATPSDGHSGLKADSILYTATQSQKDIIEAEPKLNALFNFVGYESNDSNDPTNSNNKYYVTLVESTESSNESGNTESGNESGSTESGNESGNTESGNESGDAVSTTKTKESEDVVTVLKKYLAENPTSTLFTQIPLDSSNTTRENLTLTITGLKSGYYFINSSLGALVTVTSAQPNAVVTDKNLIPNSNPTTFKTITEIKDANNNVKSSTSSVSIGDTITYKLTLNVTNYIDGKNISYYFFEDTLGAGLKYETTELTDAMHKGQVVPKLLIKLTGETAASDTSEDSDSGSNTSGTLGGDGVTSGTLGGDGVTSGTLGGDGVTSGTLGGDGVNTDENPSTEENTDSETTTDEETTVDSIAKKLTYYYDEDNPNTFKISIAWVDANGNPLHTFTDGTGQLTVEYSVKVLGNVNDLAQLKNTATWSYVTGSIIGGGTDPEPGSETDSDPDPTPGGGGEANTKSYGFSIYSYAKQSDDETDLSKALKDATYNIKDGNGKVLTFTKKGNVYKYDPDSTLTDVTSESNGYITILGLSEGTYKFTETTAPAGYNKFNEEKEVTASELVITGEIAETDDNSLVTIYVDKDGNKKENAGEEGDEITTYYNIVNKNVPHTNGTTLPSTGGIGTTIFYVVGSLLVVGAVVFLITNRRMKASN